MNEVRSFERGNNVEEGGRERERKTERIERARICDRPHVGQRPQRRRRRPSRGLPSLVCVALSLSLIVVRRAIFYSNTAQLTLALGLGGGGERQERKG